METRQFENQKDTEGALDTKAIAPPMGRGSNLDEKTSSTGKTAEHRILIVDDERSILNALTRSLTGENYRILTAESQEALSLISANRVAVIISDYGMPGISGADLLKMVRKKQPRCIRVMLTGAADIDVVPNEVADGILCCQRFVTKPWDDDQLRLTIRECILQYEAAREESTSTTQSSTLLHVRK